MQKTKLKKLKFLHIDQNLKIKKNLLISDIIHMNIKLLMCAQNIVHKVCTLNCTHIYVAHAATNQSAFQKLSR